MTVSSPRRRRLVTISSRTSRASLRRPQVVAVAADDRPQVVGGHDRPPAGTTAAAQVDLPAPAGADQHDEARIGQPDGHGRVTTRDTPSS